MYIPYLRGKRFEALALRSLAPDLVAAGNILPIVEPVKNEWRNLERALDSGLRIGIVRNPTVGDYSPPPPNARRVQLAMPATSAAVYAHANSLPAMIVGRATTVRAINTFAAANARAIFVVTEPPRDVNVLPAIAAARSSYTIVKRRAVHPPTRRQRNVDLADYFTRQPNNAGYPADEFYSDRHVTVAGDATYEHFGDYSIQGDQYSASGGRANNVALHHVYAVGARPSELRIRHYVSAAHPDVAVMWYDALSQLVRDLPSLSAMTRFNDTSVLNEYRALHRSRSYPGLGKMKELAMRHHLLLMTVVQ